MLGLEARGGKISLDELRAHECWQNTPEMGGVPADVKKVFEDFDKNRSGKLDTKELRQALKHLGLDIRRAPTPRRPRPAARPRPAVTRPAVTRPAPRRGTPRRAATEPRPAPPGPARPRAPPPPAPRPPLSGVASHGGSGRDATEMLYKYDVDGSGTLEIAEFAGIVHQLLSSGVVKSTPR